MEPLGSLTPGSCGQAHLSLPESIQSQQGPPWLQLAKWTSRPGQLGSGKSCSGNPYLLSPKILMYSLLSSLVISE